MQAPDPVTAHHAAGLSRLSGSRRPWPSNFQQNASLLVRVRWSRSVQSPRLERGL